MSRQRRSISSGQPEEESGHDRPWVYFMVDCFFLITEFFVITFKIKNDEAVLPQHLPPGSGPGPIDPVRHDESLFVHVFNESGTARYRFNEVSVGAEELSNRLATAAHSAPEHFVVKVSYDADVPWRDVMTVFNTCNKAKIAQCGLIPLRSDKAASNR